MSSKYVRVLLVDHDSLLLYYRITLHAETQSYLTASLMLLGHDHSPAQSQKVKSQAPTLIK